MALKDVLANHKKTDSYILRDLDDYLMSPRKSSDRRIDINSPSCAGKCMRANFYARKRVEIVETLSPRSRRIFENGDGVHERLQRYLLEMGRLLMDEVPLRNNEYIIQGHTDGFLTLPNLNEIAILEIKSINDRNWQALKQPLEDHKRQGMVYMFCAEERRNYLHAEYPNFDDFKAKKAKRVKEYRSWYKHLKDGSKYTRQEKLINKIDECLKADEILYQLAKPIEKVIFLYENKDNQDIKEYCVSLDCDLLDDVLREYKALNRAVKNDEIPDRGGRSRTCFECNWCDYRIDCWN